MQPTAVRSTLRKSQRHFLGLANLLRTRFRPRRDFGDDSWAAWVVCGPFGRDSCTGVDGRERRSRRSHLRRKNDNDDAIRVATARSCGDQIADCQRRYPSRRGERRTAQFTFLNQFADGPTDSLGYIQIPFIVGSVGPDGQIVVDEGPATSTDNVKVYTADGSYLERLGFNGVSNTISEPTFSAIGPDGTYYVTANLGGAVAVVGSDGTVQHDLPSPGGIIDPTGVAVSATGALYVADNSQILVYSTTYNGNTYPLLGSFGSEGTGPGEFGIAGIGAITLDSAGTNLYVTDESNHRVEVFSSGGSYESSIGDASGPGYLSQPYGVAVSGTGRVYVADMGVGIKVFSTGGTYLETVATTINGKPVSSITTVSVAPTGMVYAAGLVDGSYGAFRFFDPASWASGTNTFTNAGAGPTSVAVGSGQLLGTTLTLNATKGLVVGQTTSVNNGGSLVLAGGTLSTNSLLVDGAINGANFTMTGGALGASTITVSNGGVADFVGQPLSVALDGGVYVSDAGSQFKVEQGATFSATSLANSGQVLVGPNADFIVFNSSVNLGAVNLNDGELDVRGLLGNIFNATIQGAGTLSTTAGLSNGGIVAFNGQATVFGPVNNLASGSIEVSGSQSHIFSGNVGNSGTLTIDPGATATFQGGFYGLHGAAGTGTAIIMNSFAPSAGASANEMSFGGNLVLGHNNGTTMYLGGTAPGAGYDQVGVAGQLSLDGALQLVLIGGFMPQVGETFQLFNWGSEIGTFARADAADPARGVVVECVESVLARVRARFHPRRPQRRWHRQRPRYRHRGRWMVENRHGPERGRQQ